MHWVKKEKWLHALNCRDTLLLPRSDENQLPLLTMFFVHLPLFATAAGAAAVLGSPESVVWTKISRHEKGRSKTVVATSAMEISSKQLLDDTQNGILLEYAVRCKENLHLIAGYILGTCLCNDLAISKNVDRVEPIAMTLGL